MSPEPRHSAGSFTRSFIYWTDFSASQIDPKRGEPTSFIFTSKNLPTADYLMLIIHGTGVVRAGQWSRKYSALPRLYSEHLLALDW